MSGWIAEDARDTATYQGGEETRRKRTFAGQARLIKLIGREERIKWVKAFSSRCTFW